MEIGFLQKCFGQAVFFLPQLQKALFGVMEEFVRELEKEGISEIHYIGNAEKKVDFVPKYAWTPWMISGAGILYGTK